MLAPVSGLTTAAPCSITTVLPELVGTRTTSAHDETDSSSPVASTKRVARVPVGRSVGRVTGRQRLPEEEKEAPSERTRGWDANGREGRW